MLREIKYKKLLKSNIETLKKGIDDKKVYQPSNVSRFVFLCGANKSKDEISERRKAILEFSAVKLPHTQFFLAEKVFSTLNEEGHNDNILDIENKISAFSDFILIILESPSAFTELGAFSHVSLREKLVVINDLRFKKEESFINLGPIKAVQDSSGKERVIHYNMKDNGVHNRDAIGDVFHGLYELFKDPLKPKNRSINLDTCNPAKSFDKNSAMFLHDLIYIAGPITHREVIELLKLIFGKGNYNSAKQLLAILVSFASIERNKNHLYRSKLSQAYYDYRFDITEIMATFRNYTLKHYSARVYEY